MSLEFLRKCGLGSSQCTNKVMWNLEIKVSFCHIFLTQLQNIQESLRDFLLIQITHWAASSDRFVPSTARPPQPLLTSTPQTHPQSLLPSYHKLEVSVPNKFQLLMKANKGLRKTTELCTKISAVNKLNRWYICKWDLSHNSSSYLFCSGFINHPAWDHARSRQLLQ